MIEQNGMDIRMELGALRTISDQLHEHLATRRREGKWVAGPELMALYTARGFVDAAITALEQALHELDRATEIRKTAQEPSIAWPNNERIGG